jgi:hypothetical protein
MWKRKSTSGNAVVLTTKNVVYAVANDIFEHILKR